MVGAFRQQTIDECDIDAIRRENRIGDPLRRILIVVEAGRTEGQVEIDNDQFKREIARRSPTPTLCATVDAPTPPLAPTIAMTRPTALASGAVNSPQIARTTSIVPIGVIRYSLTPRRVSSR